MDSGVAATLYEGIGEDARKGIAIIFNGLYPPASEEFTYPYIHSMKHNLRICTVIAIRLAQEMHVVHGVLDFINEGRVSSWSPNTMFEDRHGLLHFRVAVLFAVWCPLIIIVVFEAAGFGGAPKTRAWSRSTKRALFS